MKPHKMVDRRTAMFGCITACVMEPWSLQEASAVQRIPRHMAMHWRGARVPRNIRQRIALQNAKSAKANSLLQADSTFSTAMAQASPR